MPVFPASIGELHRYSPLVPIFVGTWVFASIFDQLAIADGKPEWQAPAVVAFAVVRTSALAGVAIVARNLEFVLITMCSLATLKVSIAGGYALFAARERGLGFDRQLLRTQVQFSLPFAITQVFFALRVQADQWVVAANFSSTAFALISIGSVAMVISNFVRQPLNATLLPNISSLLGAGNFDGARKLISQGYLLLGFFLPPVLGLLILTADELVELIYTPQYSGAVPLMQIYLLGQIATVFAAGHLLQVFGYGRQAVRVGGASLLLSITLSVLGVKLFGLAGAVAGSTISLVVWECWALNRVAKGLGTSPVTLICLDHTWKVAVVVSIGVLAAYAVGSALNAPILLRLLAKILIFVAILLVGISLTNLRRSVKSGLAALMLPVALDQSQPLRNLSTE
jgi:O-antigen/teichoic acid export membrane protein